MADGSLAELHCAFSRDAKDPDGNTVYVQSKIRQSAASVWRMLTVRSGLSSRTARKGTVLACGSLSLRQ